ncbi:MAG: PAS domain-containing protein, partial [Nitrospirales bacterium]|nr:PAS domain-containing protein [Nitrospirales bacterium]
ERFLLELYAPSCAIVNERGDILYLHGRTGKYLEPAPGKASLNILTMSREGLQLDLRTALRKAVARKEDIVSEGLRVRTNGDFQTINLVIHYIRKPEYLQGLLMVVFIDVPSPEKETLPPEGCEEKVNQRVLELEFEVKSTREHLQTTIEELETSNEELKSANEELQSSNEELQSTNEELETSKEELQSVNEELLTVNAELQTKIEELSQVNSDMSNLLTSTQIATVFLNNELRIKRYTPGAVGIINLIQTDTGRPVGDVSSKLDYPDLVRDAEEVLRTLVTKEKLVSHTEGKWFTVRIMPYRTKENVIDGVVITFIDITTLKKTQEALENTLSLTEGIAETVRESLLVLDGELCVVMANKSFYQTFRTSPAETENRRIYDLGDGQWDIPELRKQLETILPENSRFRDFVVEHDFPTVGQKRMLLNAHRMVQRGSRTPVILLALEEEGSTDRR